MDQVIGICVLGLVIPAVAYLFLEAVIALELGAMYRKARRKARKHRKGREK